VFFKEIENSPDIMIYTVIPNEYGDEENGGRWQLIKVRVDGRKLRASLK